MPKSLDQVPAMVFGDFPGRTLTEEEHERMNAKLTETYREGVFVGYRYYEQISDPGTVPIWPWIILYDIFLWRYAGKERMSDIQGNRSR